MEITGENTSLYGGALQATNLALDNRKSMMTISKEKIETVIRQKDETSMEGIEINLMELQKKLLKLANAKKDYSRAEEDC